ncbi:hypothetical protein FAZ69_01115 [Trinickia terrae]|uniref:Uncharacterized protein n=1 Tax=Trinickia terrae TaxID=2571161 RepID=A0A4U1IFH2_9BURK|nr:hypothetical protein [Trinickia terrae]TKC92315.1 hypothetical protein FAZ69_01115 [Trinickia terrae]
MPNGKLEARIARLERGIEHLAACLAVQAALAQALAEDANQKTQVAQVFKQAVDILLSMQDERPMSANFEETVSLQANALLESLAKSRGAPKGAP